MTVHNSPRKISEWISGFLVLVAIIILSTLVWHINSANADNALTSDKSSLQQSEIENKYRSTFSNNGAKRSVQVDWVDDSFQDTFLFSVPSMKCSDENSIELPLVSDLSYTDYSKEDLGPLCIQQDDYEFSLRYSRAMCGDKRMIAENSTVLEHNEKRTMYGFGFRCLVEEQE